VINNHPDSTKLAQSPTFEFREIADSNPFYMKIDGPGTNIPPSGTFSITTDLTNPFQPNNTTNPEIKFEVKSFISTNTSDNHANDTTRFIQVFSNYFAYDDGSAEAGYSIYGQGAQNARVAYAFTAYKADTLSGISFYFNPLSADTSFGFRIAVWADNKGKPGDFASFQRRGGKEAGDRRNTAATRKILPRKPADLELSEFLYGQRRHYSSGFRRGGKFGG
jgi:hypothetical protein